jgi:hypothetical protein
MNRELHERVIAQIKAHPETWDQSVWHSSCGTKHCYAGWAQILGGGQANEGTAREDAIQLLGLTKAEADYLFWLWRTVDELERGPVYDEEGYDDDGFDCDGFDCDGFDRRGYNCDGYDRDGYNCDGFDRDGYDRDGYDRDGYDRDGYDRDGYDEYDYHRTGRRRR